MTGYPLFETSDFGIKACPEQSHSGETPFWQIDIVTYAATRVDSEYTYLSIAHLLMITLNSPVMNTILTATFYKFVALPDYEALRTPLIALCENNNVKGTILLASEGINGTISGLTTDVRSVLNSLRQQTRFEDLTHKESFTDTLPFYRMKVRLKREIVSMGQPDIDPSNNAGQYVKPEDWNALISEPDVVVFDTRNEYEVALGSFVNAVNPGTKSFRELPERLLDNPLLENKPKVAMFCTGGIRCEKSTAFLRQNGFDEVFHLEGGILKYLETIPADQSLWQGECFVFDERVSVDHSLKPGNYELCRACRHTLSDEDKSSELFQVGVSCPHCYHTRSTEKKRGYAERQRQVEIAAKRNQSHIGVRLEEHKANNNDE